MPYSYREVRDMYDTLKDAGVVTESLPEWSARQNQETESDMFAEGLNDNPLKRVSVGIDRVIEATGLPALGKQFGGSVGELVGNREAGEYIGEGLARQAVDTLPMFIPVAGPVYKAARLGGLAAMSGLNTYEKTGSTGAAVVSGILGAAMPGIDELVTQTALKAMGAPLVKTQVLKGTAAEQLAQLEAGALPQVVSRRFAETIPQGLGSVAAGQVAAGGVNVAQDIGTDIMTGQEVSFSPTEQLLNLTLGQAPYAAMSLTKGGRVPFGGTATKRHVEELQRASALTAEVMETKRLKDLESEEPDLAKIPDPAVISPEELANNNTRLNMLRGQQRLAQLEGTTYSEHDRQKWVEEDNEITAKQGAQVGRIYGANIDENTARRNVSGVEVSFDPETGFRRIRVADDPANGELAGKEIAYSTAHEPKVAEGTFALPEGYHSEMPTTETGHYDPVAKFKAAEERLAAAKTNADMHGVMVELNAARQAEGLRPVDDAGLAARRQGYELGNDREAAQSLLEQSRRLADARMRGRERIALGEERAVRQAELDAAMAANDVGAVRVAQDRMTAIDNRLLTITPDVLPPREAKAPQLDRVANERWTPESAPIKDLATEHATTLTEGTEHVESRRRFLTFVHEGKEEMKRRFQMSEDDYASFMERPEVGRWRGWVENSLAKGIDPQSYGERHLMAKGVMQGEAMAQTKRAMEVADKPNIAERLLASPPISAEVTKASMEMQKALAADPANMKQRLDELGHENVEGLLNEMVTTGRVDPDLINSLPPEVAAYLAARARDMDQSLSVLRAGADKRVAVLPDEVLDRALPASNAMHSILDADRNRLILTSEIVGLGVTSPPNFLSRFINGVLADPLAAAGDGWQTFKDFFKTANNYIAKSGPEGAEYVARAQQLGANGRKMATESLNKFAIRRQADGTEKLDDKWLNALRRPAIENALDRWMAENKRAADASGTGVKPLPQSDPGVQRILRGLSEDDRQTVSELMGQTVESNVTAFAHILGMMQNIGVTDGARLIGPNIKMKTADKVNLSQAVLDGIMNPQDQRAVLRAEDAKNKLMAHDPTGETFMNVNEFAAVTAGRLAGWKEFFQANPAWVTDRKYGKWQVRFMKGGKEMLETADSKRAAQELAKGNRILDVRRNFDNDDTPVDFFGGKMPPQLAQLDAAAGAMLGRHLSPDERADMALPAPSAAPSTTDGRLFKNHQDWIKKNGAYWSKQLFKAQTRGLLNSSEFVGRDDLTEMIKTHSRQLLAPDPMLGRNASKFTSTWLMGGNVATAMANAMQLFTRGAAEMTALTGKPFQSWKRMIAAVSEVGDVMVGKWVHGKEGADWRGEHKWVMEQFEKDQTGSAFEFLGNNEERTALKLKWALAHGRAGGGEASSKLMHYVTSLPMMLFRGVEDVNNKAAVLAAFDHYRQQKQPDGTYLSKEQAYRKAEEFNWAVNDVGGKANRPIKVFETLNPSLAMMATSLQTYNIGTIGQIVSYIKKGFGKVPVEGYKNPSDRYNAKVALAQLAGTQLFLAGAMGMPFVGGLLGLVNQAFPQWEITRKIRDTLHQLLDEENEEYGYLLSDVAMTGIPSMFGWDMQSRLSMGAPLPGVTEVNGFQADVLFGAPANLLKKFVTGGQKFFGGEMVEGVRDMMPPAVGKLMDLYRGQGKLVDYNGKPIADEATPGEMLGTAIGFTPTRTSKFNAARRMKIQAEAEHRRAEAQFNEEMGKRALDGKFGDVIQSIRKRASEDPKFDQIKAARSVAKAAVEWQFPRDLRNEATRYSAPVLKYFPLDRRQPNEVQKQQLQGYILQHLGVSMKPRDMTKYALMDRLAEEHPDWSRSEWAEEAERLLRRERRQTQTTLMPVEESLPL